MAHTHPNTPQLKDPVCGMTVKPDTPHRTTHDGHEVLFCSAGCKTKFQADPGRYLKPAANTEHSCCSADGTKDAHAGGQDAVTHHHLSITRSISCSCSSLRCCRREMDLPDASGDCAGWSGLLPDLRNGARADDADGRRRAEPRARRHVASLLGGSSRSHVAGARSGDGPSLVQRRCSCTSEYQRVDPVWPRDTGGSVGRLAILRAGLRFARQPKPQHVHADCARHGRGVDLQRCRPALPLGVSARVPRPPRRRRGLLRSGRRHHSACAPRAGSGAGRTRAHGRAPSAPCSTLLPRPRGASVAAKKPKYRSM